MDRPRRLKAQEALNKLWNIQPDDSGGESNEDFETEMNQTEEVSKIICI
jgi:hypothetical protein